MVDYEHVLVERAGGTVTVWLNSPERLNVLTRAMIDELTDALGAAGRSDATGIVIGAKGRLFSAGHDFSEMAGADPASVRGLFAACETLMRTVRETPQPVVARVHALATGAGCQLVATCDLAVASEDATFATPGGKGGLFCTTPLVAVGRLVGRRRALEMGMSGDPIDARTALDWGLVNQVVPAEALDGAVAAMVARVTRGGTESKAIGKRAFYEQMDLRIDEAYRLATGVMAEAALGAESQESIAAFLEKRPPDFSRVSGRGGRAEPEGSAAGSGRGG